MEPCGIRDNFTEFGSRSLYIKNSENNPMHSRMTIDNKGKFWARPVPAHGRHRPA